MKPIGRHVLIEMWECNETIDDPAAVEAALREAVSAAGATLLNLHVHQYAPQGVTGVAVLAESHFAFHSWPEHDYVAADLFTCGDSTNPQAAVAVLSAAFSPRRIETQTLERGLPHASEFLAKAASEA